MLAELRNSRQQVQHRVNTKSLRNNMPPTDTSVDLITWVTRFRYLSWTWHETSINNLLRRPSCFHPYHHNKLCNNNKIHVLLSLYQHCSCCSLLHNNCADLFVLHLNFIDNTVNKMYWKLSRKYNNTNSTWHY